MTGFWCERQQGWTFSLEDALLWIFICSYKVINVLMKDWLTNMQLLASQDINWWTGVVWVIVVFLSAVWTLIHCRGSIGEQVMNATFLQISNTHLHLGWVNSKHFWVNYSFKWFLCGFLQITSNVANFTEWKSLSVSG